MKQTITGTIYGASSVTVEQQRHSKLWLGQAVTNEESQGAKGIDMMSIKCEPSVYDQLNIPVYPAEIVIEIELRRGAKNTMTQLCVGIQQPPSPAKKSS